MKLRSFLTGLAAVVGLLLLLGAAGFYWIGSQSPLSVLASGQGKTPSAAMFVPKQAPAMISLLVNPDRLERFRQVATRPQERRRSRQELTQLKQALLANTGLDYEQDIQPWLGDEATLAVTTLDIDRDRANGSQPGYLLALSTQNPEQSREFLQLFWQKKAIAGADLSFEQYKGVKLIYANQGQKAGEQGSRGGRRLAPLISIPSTLDTVASAVVGDQFVLFANDPKVLRDAITNVQAAELNLSAATVYQQSLETLTQPHVGLAFVNVPALTRWIDTFTRSTEQPILKRAIQTQTQPKLAQPNPTQTKSSQTTLDQTKPNQALAIALRLDPNGLLADTAMPTDGKAAPPSLDQPVEALRYISRFSPISAAGDNLDRLWSQLSITLQSYEPLNQLVNEPLQTLQTQWKLDLAKDVFSWVKGDYAIGLQTKAEARGQKAEGRRQTGKDLDWVFVAKRNEDAKQAIAHLDAIAQQQGASIGSLQLGEHRVSAWTRLSAENQSLGNRLVKGQPAKTVQAEVQGVHTTVDNYEIFASSMDAIETALESKQSLTEDANFQTAIAPIQQPNNGYLYLDWEHGRSLVEQQFPVVKLIELAAQPLFSHLRSLTLSSYGTQAGVQHSSLFLRLN
jgi:Protein of unknown function (DUF3352)